MMPDVNDMSDPLAPPCYQQLSINLLGTDLILDADGSVQAATVPALVERLTTHETPSDPAFAATFLLTYKSFTTLDELVDLLVQRFHIQPPDDQTPVELEGWKTLKQHVVQSRVLDTFEAMLTDNDVIETNDIPILDRIQRFLQQEDVSGFAASQRILALIDRAQGGEFSLKAPPNVLSPPEYIAPVTDNRQSDILDMDSLELARQVTIVESQLYQQIRSAEILARSRDGKIHHEDNVARIINLSNGLANWVSDTILSRKHIEERATLLKQFILVADSCRMLQNYSSMVAITSGLNSPPIRRLEYSWKQVKSQHMERLRSCETTIDTGNNFTNYRTTLAKVAPPCVPFIGVFLTTLASIQAGSEDTFPGNLVNFQKRQKVSEVIQDVRRWQNLPHRFHPLSAVQMYIEDSLGKFSDQGDIEDKLWDLSVELEPKTPAEKMARLLQETGYL